MNTPSSYAYSPPNPLVDPEQKLTEEWMLNAVQYYHSKFYEEGPAIYRKRSKDYFKMRQYGRGEQSIDQYKTRMGIRDQQGKEIKSWRNIDWTILKIAPRFKRVIMGKIKNATGEIRVKAIDPASINAERQYKSNLQEFMLTSETLENLKNATGVDYTQPVEDGVPMPINMDDVDVHMQMFYKDRYAMEMEDALQYNFDKNNFQQIAWEVIEDLTETGDAATRTWVDKTNNLRIRRVIPERMGVYSSKFPDGRDAKAVWEYVDTSLDEFVEQNAGNELTRDELESLWKNAQGWNDSYAQYSQWDYFGRNSDEATVMDIRFISIDTWVYQEGTNRFGNPTMTRKPVSWYDPNKGTDGVVIKEVMNVYECKWLLGTDYVYDFKMADMMPRSTRNLATTNLGFSLYSTDSIIEKIFPVLDSIQINWLQYQTHLNKTKPGGVEIEMSAFEDINMGKGMEKMSPKQVLQMFYDTGNIVWRRKDWSGRDGGWKPITESAPILPDGALAHFNIIVQLINMLRDLTGLNEVVDGSTPRPDIGKTVSEIASLNSDNILETHYHAWDSIFESTAKTIVNLIPMQLQAGPVMGFADALGENSMRFLQLNSDIQAKEFGIQVMQKATAEEKAKLQKYVEIALTNQEISTDAAYMIENEDNLYRAANLLMLKRRQRQQEIQQMKKDETEMLAMQQSQAAQDKAEGDAYVKQVENQEFMKREQVLWALRVREDREKTMNAIILEKVKQGHELTVQERDLMAKWDIAVLTNETDIVQTQILAKTQEKVSKQNGNAQKKNITKQAKNKQLDN